MSQDKWNVTFQVYRQKGDQPGRFVDYTLTIDADEYILDGVERIWAYVDRTLTFRHACHHSTCGACGMRVNGVEKLTCITRIRDMTHDGGVVRVEPLRNFPVISDLVVDMSTFYTRMEQVGHRSVLPVDEEGMPRPKDERGGDEIIRLSDCIECGCCVSACPIATTSSGYLGPAALAGAQQRGLHNQPGLLELVDSEIGVWRCHSAFECSAVCPSFVEPAWRIMDLRRQVVVERVKNLFKPKNGAHEVKKESVG